MSKLKTCETWIIIKSKNTEKNTFLFIITRGKCANAVAFRNLLFHWVKVRRWRTLSSIATYSQYYRDVLSVRTRTYWIVPHDNSTSASYSWEVVRLSGFRLSGLILVTETFKTESVATRYPENLITLTSWALAKLESVNL